MEPRLVYIPSGPFLMGTSPAQIQQLVQVDETAQAWQAKAKFEREQPQHLIDLPGYYLGKYSVTVAEYRAFISAGGYQNSRYWTQAGWTWRVSVDKIQPEYWEDAQWTGEADLPVVGVSWYEALAYCSWLSEISGKHYRLPSEAEWEKAARGSDGRLYPWGNAFNARLCHTRASRLNRTVSILAGVPDGNSPYGCTEMAGNISEWTSSQFKPYPYLAEDGREQLEGAFLRVIRGGSWFKPPFRARTAVRGMNDPFFADTDVGFRCLCED